MPYHPDPSRRQVGVRGSATPGGIRSVSGHPESGMTRSRGIHWMQQTPGARATALRAAREELAATPGTRVRGLELRHGIPRGYLAERLKAEAYARRVTDAAEDVALRGRTPLDAARHHGVRLASLTHRLKGKS